MTEENHVKVSVDGKYGFLAREGLRQMLVDDCAVTIPPGVQHLTLAL